MSKMIRFETTIVEDDARAILATILERHRQVSTLRWTPQHDDEHDPGTLAGAAAAYAGNAACMLHPLNGTALGDDEAQLMGFPAAWDWKPKTPREDLVRAAALIIAEIARLDRAEKKSPA